MRSGDDHRGVLCNSDRIFRHVCVQQTWELRKLLTLANQPTRAKPARQSGRDCDTPSDRHVHVVRHELNHVTIPDHASIKSRPRVALLLFTAIYSHLQSCSYGGYVCNSPTLLCVAIKSHLSLVVEDLLKIPESIHSPSAVTKAAR